VEERIRRITAAEGSPRPLSTYPYAVRAQGLIFCSGQGARDPFTNLEAGIERADSGEVRHHDIAKQMQACLRNLEATLVAADATLGDLLEIMVFLKEMADYDAMNGVYAQWFPSGGPARTTIGVADLPGDNFVEVRAVALAPVVDGAPRHR